MEDFKAFYERYWATEAPPEHDRHAPERRHLLSQVLATAAADARILDYGCGHGALVGYLSKLGFSAEGVDLAKAAITKAQTRYPGLSFQLLSDWAPDRDAFDICVCFEVLEHVFEPRSLLEKLYDLLKPGGHLALSTPYHGVAKNMGIALRGFDRHFDVEGPHIRFFTDRSLVRLVTACGFQVLAIQHYGRIPFLQAGTFVWARRG